MKLSSILLFFGLSAVGIANAGPYLDLGIGAAIDVNADEGRNCIRDWNKDAQSWGCSANPLGYVAIGYEHRGFSVEASHWSSLVDKDAGLNIISIKKRLQF